MALCGDQDAKSWEKQNGKFTISIIYLVYPSPRSSPAPPKRKKKTFAKPLSLIFLGANVIPSRNM